MIRLGFRNPRKERNESEGSGASDYAITRHHILASSCHHTSREHGRRSPCGHHQGVELKSHKCDTYGGVRHPKTCVSFQEGRHCKSLQAMARRWPRKHSVYLGTQEMGKKGTHIAVTMTLLINCNGTATLYRTGLPPRT